MNRSKFVINLEYFWIEKYGTGWAEGEVFWQDLLDAAKESGINTTITPKLPPVHKPPRGQEDVPTNGAIEDDLDAVFGSVGPKVKRPTSNWNDR